MKRNDLITPLLLLLAWSSLLWGQGTALESTNDRSPVNQNSHQKIRVVPNELASKIGAAIAWETDYDTAMKKVADSDKPLFWYVPRLAGTFMDRKKEIDRYMRAGPFSDPQIIASINEHYIPLLSVPGKTESKRYTLKTFKFVEPGFLIVMPDGTNPIKIDRMTTLHSRWMSQFLVRPTEMPQPSDSLKKARQQLATRNYDQCLALGTGDSQDEAVELQMISAMATFRLGKHADAIEKFASIGKSFPQHPLGWKAAAEAQRIGPFVRGFEVFGELPDGAMSAGLKSLGSAAPPDTYTEPQLWQSGVDFLLSMQNEAGGVEDSDYDYGGSDGLPNVHVAVTSIVAMALAESRDREQFKDLQPRIDQAIQKAVAYVNDPQNVNTRDRDEIFWAYLYRLKLVNRLFEKGILADLAMVQKSLDALIQIQAPSGDWYHEYNNPFVTASALWAINESQRLGAKVDSGAVGAGIAALNRCRFANAAWSYQSPGEDSPALKNANQGQRVSSAGRMPLCQGALVVWEQAEEGTLVESLQSAFQMHQTLDVARKYDDHTSSYSYGGFFYWYDMQTRTEAIRQVSDPNARRAFALRQREQVMAVPEIDGCFVDSHEIGRSYGTAMALLCLSDCGKAESGEQDKR